MRRLAEMTGMAGVMALALCAACSSDDSGSTMQDPGNSSGTSSGGTLDGGRSSGSSSSGGSGGGSGADGGGNTARDGGRSDGGGVTPYDAGAFGDAGNPSGSCRAGVPARGAPVDTSHPTTVIGSGTAASCTFAALQSAVAKGGTITFNCGSAPATILVTATLTLPTDRTTVIDGGGKITLDGGGAVRILSFDHGDYRVNENGLTLQHIALVRGKATPTEAIPVAPAPCSQGWNDGEGGAVYIHDGNLVVIDAVFQDNQAAQRGPDTGGGAIYIVASKRGALIVKSTFKGNSAANAGAVGCLQSPLEVYDSLFTDNRATGDGANNDDASKCSAINNGQHEIGSGGNGGALYNDGVDVDVTLCGDSIMNNAAGTGGFGGGLFFTSNNFAGALTITDTTMTGNTGGHWTVSHGGVANVGTAVGTNCASATVTNSTLQGM